MSNLLDKASIILTPTAYNNGEALCVKPSDGSGDFDFSRNSAATRVNAQGLVENVQILSSNLVQNGDFSEEGAEEVSNGSFSQEGSELITNGDFATDSDWIKGTGWSIANGTATYDGTGGTSALIQNGVIEINKTYKVTIDVISNEGSGANTIFLGNNTINTQHLEVGSYTFYGASTSGIGLAIYGRSGEIFKIDNVSVKEVGQDWTLGTGWSIGEDKASSDGSQTSNSSLFQSNVLTQNKYYKFEFTLSNVTSGAVRLRNGIGDYETYISYQNSNGTYTAYSIVNSSNKTLVVDADSSFIGSITNISVKEVGQDWNLIGTATITENQANIVTASAVTGISQTNILTIGESYKLTYNIVSNNNGGLKISGNEIPSVVGNNTYYFTASATALEILRNSGVTDISITNISVIEITDDTNLPRINYEGFSYQDALGSELVVNPSWVVQSGSTWLASDDSATCSGGSGDLYVNLSLDTSKTYLLSFDVTDYTSGQIRLASSKYTQGATTSPHIQGLGNFEIYIKSTSSFLYFFSNAFIGSIDNVSVKEYLGQEPIPNSGCGHWLWEPQSTNLITQSELFSDASWVKINSSVASGFASPSGNTNAYKLIASVSNTDHRTRTAPIPTAAVGTTVTFSIYIKPQEITKIALVDNWTNLSYGVVNLTTNSVIEEAQGTTSVTEILNGFRRVSFTYQTANINTLPAVYLLDDAYTSGNPTSYTFASDGTSGVYIWGAQLEQQSYATSYIPTDGSTVTRNQDVCNNGGSLASINSTEGVLYAEIARSEEENLYRLLGIDDGTSNNYVKMGFENSRGAFWIRAVINGVTSISSDNALTSNPNEFYKIAIRYQSGNSAIYINGTSVLTTTTTFSSGNFTALDFNHWNNSLNFFGKTKAVAVWKEALSDQELTELTTI